MKLSGLGNFLNIENGQHTTNVYIPSIKREVPMKPLTTANVKTLTRISIFDEFDLNNELLKLSLFDKLTLESKDSCGIDADTLTQIDFLSVLIGLRKLLDNTVSFSFTCPKCNHEFNHTIDLEEKFLDFIYDFQRKKLIYEKTDLNGIKWKFELESYTMKDYLYYRYYIEKIKELDKKDLNVFYESNFIRFLLYIRNIWKNDEKIEDWKDQTLLTKIKFLNSLPSNLILNTNNKINNDCLTKFIKENFDEERLFEEILKIQVKCPECGETYDGLFNLDDFFYVLGYSEDNQNIFMKILETETFLIYHRWFTLDQINSMSYLDFTIYSERILAMWEEEEKRKQEEKQQNYDSMMANFEALGNLLVGE